VLQHLVRAVRRPDLLAREAVAEVVGEALAQRGELAVGVAVDVAQSQGDGIQDVVGDLLRNGCVFSLTFSATGRAACGAPYGVMPRRWSRRGRSSRRVLTSPIVEPRRVEPSGVAATRALGAVRTRWMESAAARP
jgi:hypothetical protein